MRIAWYQAALGAAVVWGIHYPLIAHALKRVSLVSVLLLTAIGVLLLVPFFLRDLRADYATLLALSWPERLPLLALALTSLAGSALLFVSIGEANATLASLIEISYPVFVAVFSYLLFGRRELNASMVAGAALVFIGLAVIIANNR